MDYCLSFSQLVISCGLLVFTILLWKSTQRLAASTNHMAGATRTMADVELRRTKLEHESRLIVQWDTDSSFADLTFPRFSISDRRNQDIAIEAIYVGMREVGTPGGDYVEMQRVYKWLYTALRPPGGPIKFDAPEEVCPGRSYGIYVEIIYKDAATEEIKHLSIYTGCSLDDNGAVTWDDIPIYDRHDVREDDAYPRTKRGLWVGKGPRPTD